MDILIVVASALVALLLTLAIAVLWVASRYEEASSEPNAAPPEQPARALHTRRFRRQMRIRASSRP